jgi:hypothetical protein
MHSLKSPAPAPADVIAFQIPSNASGDAKLRLRALLGACLAYEKSRFIRGELVTLLAISSAGVWIAAVRPDFLPSSWRFGLEAFWALCFLCTVGAALAEWMRHRAWLSLTSEPGSHVDDPGAP